MEEAAVILCERLWQNSFGETISSWLNRVNKRIPNVRANGIRNRPTFIQYTYSSCEENQSRVEILMDSAVNKIIQFYRERPLPTTGH
jgi:hypothetical protein